jgi:transglutaminase-like putative cysteine protease
MNGKRSLLAPAAAGAVLLTMLALAQVFTRQAWFYPSVLAVGLAFGAGWLARRLDVPEVLAPALSLLTMLALLGLAFLPDTTAFGLPTAATLQAIGASLSDAAADIKETAPPADPTEALTLLATAGVFLVAMVVDHLVFWRRRPVAAGLPLLALYLIPTSMADSANVFAFVLATLGYLGLLIAEGRDRARSWGRRLSGMDLVDESADVSHVARVGRRIGSSAVVLALCVPLALPSVGEGLISGEGDGLFGRGNGGRTKEVINPIVEIQAQLNDTEVRDLFRVRTDTPDYLRLTSLDHFDGAEWSFVERNVDSDHRVSKGDIPTPPEFKTTPTSVATYNIEIGPLAVAWLPLPYAPRRVDVHGDDGDWRYEDHGLAVFSVNETSDGVSYTAESVLPTPTREQLRQDLLIPDHIADQYLKVPENTPEAAMEVLREQTEGQPTKYDQAVALNEYFRDPKNGFVYDTTVKGSGSDALTQFLTRKRGYCEQYAATMAYLARLSGIPARVVVGFTSGTPQGDGSYIVRNKDAHAWPELYFPSAGWVRFEPTPISGTALPDYARRVVEGGNTPPVTPTPTPSADPSAGPATATPSGDPRQLPEQEDDPAAALPPGQQPGGSDGGVPVLPLALLVVLVAAATPSVVAWATARRRRSVAGDHLARIHAAWASLADAAEDAGHPLRAADSPRGAARRLVAAAGLVGPAADEVTRLATAEERARYALSAPPADGLEAGARAVRKALLAGLPGRARVRATVFPPSAVRRIVEGVRAVGEWVDRSRDAVRARLVRLVRRQRPKTA